MASPEGVEEIKSCFYHSMATKFNDFFVGSHPWVFTSTLTKKSSDNRHFFSGFSLLKENSEKRTSVYDEGTLFLCFALTHAHPNDRHFHLSLSSRDACVPSTFLELFSNIFFCRPMLDRTMKYFMDGMACAVCAFSKDILLLS